VARLQAARVALERRYSQLDASKDRRAGILSPFVPPTDRPWREGGGVLQEVQLSDCIVMGEGDSSCSLAFDPPLLIPSRFINLPGRLGRVSRG